jgi:transcriptional regulator GlxA family with amidase domain
MFSIVAGKIRTLPAMLYHGVLKRVCRICALVAATLMLPVLAYAGKGNNIQMTLPSSPKKVVVLALPGAREPDLASVLDVFTLANWQLAPNPAYQVEVVTSDAKGRVTGMTGLRLVGNVPYFACTGEIDTLLIAGGISLVRSDPEEPSLVAWLRNRAFECRRVASICTGAFVLARAGVFVCQLSN